VNSTVSLASFLVKIGADTADFDRGMNHASSRLGTFTQGLRQAASFAMGLVLAGGITQSLRSAITEGIKFNGIIEQATIAFTTLTGSAAQANSMVQQLYNFAAYTPFQFPDLLANSKKLMAFGFNIKQIIPMLTGIGNAAAGLGLTGQEGIGRIIIAIGQMHTKARVMTQEMNQLTESGIPAWEILAKSMGNSTQEVMDLVYKGIVPADLAIEALINGMNERFPGMMEKQQKSMWGLFSTFKDYARSALGTATKPLYDWFKELLPVATDFAKRFSEGFKLKGLEGGLMAGFNFDPAIATTFINTINMVKSIFMELKMVITTIGGPIVKVALFIINHWKQIGPVVYAVVGAFIAVKTTIAAVTIAISILNGVSKTNPWILLASAFAGAAVALWGLRQAEAEATESIINNAIAVAQDVQQTQQLIGEYAFLTSSAENAAGAQAQLNSITQELIDKLPGAANLIDQQTSSLITQEAAVRGLTQALIEKNKYELEAGMMEAQRILPDLQDQNAKNQLVLDQSKAWKDKVILQKELLAVYEGDYKKLKTLLSAEEWKIFKDTAGMLPETMLGDSTATMAAYKKLLDWRNLQTESALKNASATQKEMDKYQKMLDDYNKIKQLEKDMSDPDYVKKLKEQYKKDYGAGYEAKTEAEIKAELERQKKEWEEAFKAQEGDKDANKYYDQLKSGVKGFTNELRKQNQEFANFIGLFDKLEGKGSTSGSTLLRRLKKQLEAIMNWKQYMAIIESRVDNPAMIDALRQMGPESWKQIRGLSRLSNEQLQEYSKVYTQKGTETYGEAYKAIEYKHSGEITVKGVNSYDELVGVTEIVAKEIQADSARYTNIPGASKSTK